MTATALNKHVEPVVNYTQTSTPHQLCSSSFRGRNTYGPLCLKLKQDFFLTSSNAPEPYQPRSTKVSRVTVDEKKQVLFQSLSGSKISHFCPCDICDAPSSLFSIGFLYIFICLCGELTSDANLDPCGAHDWDSMIHIQERI